MTPASALSSWSLPVWGPVLLFSAGCGWFGWDTQPDWVSGTSRAHPSERYITGLGEGATVTAATEQAYTSVAKVFKTQVSSEAREWESYLLVESRGKSRDERRLTLDQVTKVTTDKVLENVSVLDKWFDPQRRQYVVLAGLLRAQAETATLAHLSELDQTIDARVGEARQALDKLARIRQLKRAAKALVLREAYNSDLRVIRLSGQGVPARYRVSELTAELEQIVSGVPIGLDITGDQREPIERALSEGLLREGLTVAGEGDGAPAGTLPELILTGLVRIWPIEVRDPQFKYVRWCSDFVLTERATQRVVGALSRGDKIGHVSSQEATAKALRSIQQEFASDLAKVVASYVYGESDLTSVPTTGACPRDGGEGGKPAM